MSWWIWKLAMVRSFLLLFSPCKMESDYALLFPSFSLSLSVVAFLLLLLLLLPLLLFCAAFLCSTLTPIRTHSQAHMLNEDADMCTLGAGKFYHRQIDA